jgi:general transcriptional corepressor CYC8
MLKCCSSWDGFITSRVTHSSSKRGLSNTLKSLSHQVCDMIRSSTALMQREANPSPDNSDAQSWYLLGRCYMSQQKYPKAYEAYQQAVYRDGKNPTFWCSIGVLYYQINQYRDALDAYSRAIRLNPYISEVWYDLGTLVSSYPI